MTNVCGSYNLGGSATPTRREEKRGWRPTAVRPLGGHLGARDDAGERCEHGTRAFGLNAATDRGMEGARVHRLSAVLPRRA